MRRWMECFCGWQAASRRVTLLEQARAAYREPGFEPAAAAAALLECAREHGALAPPPFATFTAKEVP